MRPLHPAPLLKPTGSRTVDRGPWFILVDPVPRYPAIDNEIDERAADLDRSAPIRRQLAGKSRRQPRTATAGGSQKPGQDRHYRMLSMARRPHNATRVPPISGQTARFKPKSTAIRRPRTPCRPAGAWAMFLTNSCYKNDIGYNYAIISYFRGPDP